MNLQKPACCAFAAISLAVCPTGRTQTTRPALDLDTLLLKAGERPLKQAVLKRPDGSPLSEEQKSDIERSNGMMEAAASARGKGDFAAASQQSLAAFKIRQKVLGDEHFLTMTAQVSAATMKAWAERPPDQQQRLAESERRFQAFETFVDQGEYVKAQEAAQEGLAIREKVLPKDDVEIATALMDLCDARLNLGRLEEAEQALRPALPVIKKTYGSEHPVSARAYDRFGWLRFLQSRQGSRIDKDKAADAVESLNRAVHILQETVGENADTAESLDNLGSALTFIGSGRRALKCKLRGLVIRTRLLGPDAVLTGESLSNLAWFYEQSGEGRDLIIPLHTRALAIFEKNLTPDHPYIASERRGLIKACLRQGKIDDAIRLLEAVVAANEKRPDPVSPDAASMLAHLGNTYRMVGRLEDALRAFGRADECAQALYKNGDRQAAESTLEFVAQACEASRMFGPAIKHLEQLVAWERDKSGEPSAAASFRVANLGRLYVEIGQLDEAANLLEKVVAASEKDKGEDHRDLAVPLLYLAKAYEKKGDLAHAEKTCDKAVGISESKLGRNARLTGYAMMQLGRIQAMSREFDMAEFHLDQAREVLSRYEKDDALGALECLGELARLNALREKPVEAIPLLREGIERCRKFEEERERPFIEAAEAHFLKQLLDMGDSASGGERGSWTAELKAVLIQLRAKKALTPEEEEWLAELR